MAVTPEGVRRIANEHLTRGRMTLVVPGDVKIVKEVDGLGDPLTIVSPPYGEPYRCRTRLNPSGSSRPPFSTRPSDRALHAPASRATPAGVALGHSQSTGRKNETSRSS
jgi:hypothetical protein